MSESALIPSTLSEVSTCVVSMETLDSVRENLDVDELVLVSRAKSAGLTKTVLSLFGMTKHHKKTGSIDIKGVGENMNKNTLNQQAQVARRIDIKTCGGEGVAIVLREFLSQTECQQHIESAEESGHLSPSGYHPSIRQVDRWQNHREDLALALFERVKPFLEPFVDLSNHDKSKWPSGVHRSMREGIWIPTGLNPSFRICRYQPGGFFVPHYDGQEFISEKVKSIKTLMIYLNDNFEGGATKFYNGGQRHYREGEPRYVTDSLQPVAGDALVFDSAITHEGGTVTKGYKYILRTEIMCTWTSSNKSTNKISTRL